ncbi:40S ribosomal protein S29 [Sparganum proliferum]
MRQARDRQRESIALSGSNPGKSVANIFRHRSSSKRGHELPPLLNDNKVFLTDDTDKAELFSAFFAKHLATESDPLFAAIMGFDTINHSHPKTCGQGSRCCRVCSNRHGLIRKYGLNMCQARLNKFSVLLTQPVGRKESRGFHRRSL